MQKSEKNIHYHEDVRKVPVHTQMHTISDLFSNYYSNFLYCCSFLFVCSY